MPWTCNACTFINESDLAPICAICRASKPSLPRQGSDLARKALSSSFCSVPAPPVARNFRVELVAILKRHAPGRLSQADAVLAKYAGREQHLLEQLRQRYGIAAEAKPSPPMPVPVASPMLLPSYSALVGSQPTRPQHASSAAPSSGPWALAAKNDLNLRSTTPAAPAPAPAAAFPSLEQERPRSAATNEDKGWIVPQNGGEGDASNPTSASVKTSARNAARRRSLRQGSVGNLEVVAAEQLQAGEITQEEYDEIMAADAFYIEHRKANDGSGHAQRRTSLLGNSAGCTRSKSLLSSVFQTIKPSKSKRTLRGSLVSGGDMPAAGSGMSAVTATLQPAIVKRKERRYRRSVRSADETMCTPCQGRLWKQDRHGRYGERFGELRNSYLNLFANRDDFEADKSARAHQTRGRRRRGSGGGGGRGKSGDDGPNSSFNLQHLFSVRLVEGGEGADFSSILELKFTKGVSKRVAFASEVEATNWANCLEERRTWFADVDTAEQSRVKAAEKRKAAAMKDRQEAAVVGAWEGDLFADDSELGQFLASSKNNDELL